MPYNYIGSFKFPWSMIFMNYLDHKDFIHKMHGLQMKRLVCLATNNSQNSLIMKIYFQAKMACVTNFRPQKFGTIQ